QPLHLHSFPTRRSSDLSGPARSRDSALYLGTLPGVDAAYRTAFLDWLACAFAGRRERAARAARAAGDGTAERVAWMGTAGHVLRSEEHTSELQSRFDLV